MVTKLNVANSNLNYGFFTSYYVLYLNEALLTQVDVHIILSLDATEVDFQ